MSQQRDEERMRRRSLAANTAREAKQVTIGVQSQNGVKHCCTQGRCKVPPHQVHMDCGYVLARLSLSYRARILLAVLVQAV